MNSTCLRAPSPAAWARVCLFVLVCLGTQAVHAFDFEDVAKRAKQLSNRSYKPVPETVPYELRELDYDQYRDIRFRPERAHWREDKLPFELQFFHPGRGFTRPIHVNEVTPKGVKPIHYDPRDFDYGRNTRLDPKSFGDLGYAGFRVHTALNSPDYKDEVLVFLGASYFRALGMGQRYGLSARALAIDTAQPTGEEFPVFREFWVERPAPTATDLVIYALLDSPRATGAYRFILRPGAPTIVEVKSRLYLRDSVAVLGIAPLTSMYQFGENQPLNADDFRPEVHDSDGLQVATGSGEWIWRPLINPSQLLVTSFSTTNPRGFGLMQRDRSFTSYEDLEARYELRPSGWIEPIGDWGPGRVELVQIPTPDETNDNIVAYWVPTNPPKPGQPMDFDYRIVWQGSSDTRPPNGWAIQTRKGRGFVKVPDGHIKYVVDFDGPALQRLDAAASVEAVVDASANALIVETNTFRNTATGGWRMTVRFKRLDDTKPVELRGYLRHQQDTLTETWSTILPPK